NQFSGHGRLLSASLRRFTRLLCSAVQAFAGPVSGHSDAADQESSRMEGVRPQREFRKFHNSQTLSPAAKLEILAMAQSTASASACRGNNAQRTLRLLALWRPFSSSIEWGGPAKDVQAPARNLLSR